MSRSRVTLLVCWMLLAPSVTAVPPSSDDVPTTWQCVDSQRIGGWSFEDERTILINVGPDLRYRIELSESVVSPDLLVQGHVTFMPDPQRRLCAALGHVVIGRRWIPIRSITPWRAKGR